MQLSELKQLTGNTFQAITFTVKMNNHPALPTPTFE